MLNIFMIIIHPNTNHNSLHCSFLFFSLQQLYLATGDPTSTDDGNPSQITGSLSLAEPVACADNSGPLLCSDSILRDCPGIEQLCVVCHYFPLSRALLPCRHTCICAVCFSKYTQHSTNVHTWTFCCYTDSLVDSNNWHNLNNWHKTISQETIAYLGQSFKIMINLANTYRVGNSSLT